MSILNHIAIIPDGNRRWAKSRHLPSFEGHRIAAQTTLPKLIKKAHEMGIKYFTIWAMSTENFTKRSKIELQGLFMLIKIIYKLKWGEVRKNQIRIRIIGDISRFPEDIKKILRKIVVDTSNNTKGTLIFALNYGGRDEIIRAFQKYKSDKNYLENEKKLTKEKFGEFLDTNEIPDPDLIIRTGGEKRLSGFMPWQSEYSELYFTDIYFPDFDEKELEKAVTDYSLRKRRFGK